MGFGVIYLLLVLIFVGVMGIILIPVRSYIFPFSDDRRDGRERFLMKFWRKVLCWMREDGSHVLNCLMWLLRCRVRLGGRWYRVNRWGGTTEDRLALVLIDPSRPRDGWLNLEYARGVVAAIHHDYFGFAHGMLMGHLSVRVPDPPVVGSVTHQNFSPEAQTRLRSYWDGLGLAAMPSDEELLRHVTGVTDAQPPLNDAPAGDPPLVNDPRPPCPRCGGETRLRHFRDLSHGFVCQQCSVVWSADGTWTALRVWNGALDAPQGPAVRLTCPQCNGMVSPVGVLGANGPESLHCSACDITWREPACQPVAASASTECEVQVAVLGNEQALDEALDAALKSTGDYEWTDKGL